jgi:hypothetical protein
LTRFVDIIGDPTYSLFGRRRRPWGISAVAAIAIVWAVATATAPRFVNLPVIDNHPTIADGHALLSLRQAFNQAYCGSTTISDDPTKSFRQLLREPSNQTNPIRDVVVRRAGTISQYCSEESQPFMNNENGLMLLVHAALTVRPLASTADLERMFRFVRWVWIGLFVAVCLRLGSSVPLAAAATVLAAAILADQAKERGQLSLYSWLLPVVLLNIAYYAWAISRPSTVRAVTFVAAGGGALTALTYSIRSTYLAVAVAMALMYVAVALTTVLRGESIRKRLLVTCVVVTSMLAGFSAFDRLLLRPKLPKRYAQNYSYHAIAHPLVLAVALPPNDLSRREGIEWNDARGLVLARRIDPAVTFLDGGYEQALFTYYKYLWHEYPSEMRQVYRQKARIAGAAMIEAFQHLPYSSSTFALPMLPYTGVSDGAVLTAGFGVAAVIAFVLALVTTSVSLFIVAALAMTVVLLQIEATVILPHFYILYQAVPLFCLGLASLLTFEAAIAWSSRRPTETDDVSALRSRWLTSTQRGLLGESAAVMLSLVVASWTVASVAGSIRSMQPALVTASSGVIIYLIARTRSSRSIAYVVAAGIPIALLALAEVHAPTRGIDLHRVAAYVGEDAAPIEAVPEQWLSLPRESLQSLSEGGRLDALGQVAFDGYPAADFAYLLASPPIRMDANTTIVAVGTAADGAVSIGLQAAGRWVEYTNVTTTGRFAVTLPVKRTRDYQIVVASALTKDKHCEFSDLRFALVKPSFQLRRYLTVWRQK